MPHATTPSPAQAAPAPIRCLSFDVEEYFHIEAAHGQIPPEDRPRWPSRVEPAVDRLLALLDRLGAAATFFFLGDVARRHPRLAPRCAAAGHEIACHGDQHDRLHRLDPARLAADLARAKATLEDQVGRPVLGYRAPTWSLTRQTAWAAAVIRDAGFAYDASVFPVSHPWYGVPDAPDHPFHLAASDAPESPSPPLLELPPLTLRLTPTRRVAAAGGGYFRLLPLALMRAALRQAARDRRPAILYFHPWEFDSDTPRMPLPALGRVRTYTGLASAERRLARLLAPTGPWTPIAPHLPALQSHAAAAPPYPLAPPAAATRHANPGTRKRPTA